MLIFCHSFVPEIMDLGPVSQAGRELGEKYFWGSLASARARSLQTSHCASRALESTPACRIRSTEINAAFCQMCQLKGNLTHYIPRQSRENP